MQIKQVRDPNEEEKNNIIPKLLLFGTTTVIITALIYLIDFHFYDIEESMYITQNIISSRLAAEHNLVIQLFEKFYGRDYMLNKLEGLPVSAIISIVAEAAIGLIYKVHTTIKGMR